MRSLLFVPAHQRDLYDKAVRSDADTVVFDLEDSCHPARKSDALEMVSAWATAVYTKDMQKEFFVRVNSPLDARRLSERGALSEMGLVVPKLRSSAELESYREMDPRTLSIRRMLAIVETPQAVRGVDNIALHPAVRGLIFGTADLAAALGLPPCYEGRYQLLDYAKLRMLWAAKAAGKIAIDGVCLDLDDNVLAHEFWRDAFRCGFDGAVCLTPSQAKMAVAAFTPNEADVRWARQVFALEDQENAQRLGDGTVCGAPTFKQARAILRKAGETA